MKKNLSIFIVLNIFSFCIVLAQEPSMPNILKPSPNTASLGKYGNYPVSNYTGTPNISILIYNVKSREIEIPISLSYHASGIKVSEEASWVGLGWSLNAGGVISRQVIKKDDFGERGYAINGYVFPQIDGDYKAAGLYTPVGNDPGIINPITYPETEYMENENGGVGSDTEPDIYSYNFMGFSGKLFIKKIENGVIRAIATDQNNLDFVYHQDIKQWEVTDVKGWKYFFGTTEISKYNTQTTPPPPIGVPEISLSAETAWYIDKIITPKGDKISFQYIRNSTNGFVINFSGISEEKTSARGDCNNDFVYVADTPPNSYTSTGPGVNSFASRSKSYTLTQEVYLDKILFNEGSVLFNRSNANRLDRLYDEYATPPKALDNIVVYDNNNKKIQDVQLKTSYFGQTTSSKPEMSLRLKLDEVVFYPNNSNPQFYKFQYSSIELPSKDSYSQDHWGYYNGADNANLQTYKYINSSNQEIYGGAYPSSFSTLVPYYYNNDGNILVIGANREPNKDYNQAGILMSIVYPTGGKTTFEYEPNLYTKNGFANTDPDIITVNSSGTKETTFTLTKTTFVLLEYTFKNSAYIGTGGIDSIALYQHFVNTDSSIQKLDGSNFIKFFPSKVASSPYFSNNETSFVSVRLTPGTYKIKAYNDNFIYFSINLRATILRDTSGIFTKMGGGIRVKSIKNIDGLGNSYKKDFNYSNDDGSSSGKLMSENFYLYNETSYFKAYHNVNLIGTINAENYFINHLGSCFNESVDFPKRRYIKIFGSSIIPEGASAGGQSIGYTQVTVTENNPFPFSNTTSLGKSVYMYQNNSDTQIGSFLPNLKEYEHTDNGQLISEKHYDSSGRIVSEKSTTYTEGNIYRIIGFRITKVTNDYCFAGDCGSGDYFNRTLFNRFYKKDLKWWYPSQIIEKTYPQGVGVPLITTKNYTYNNLTHKQLTKEETLFPDGITQNKTYKYADEVGNQLMKDKNMVGIPLVTESNKIINGTSKSLQKVETYFPKTTSELTSTNGLMLPIWTKTYGLNNLSSGNNFVTYDKYDSKGNILQYSTKGLNPTTIIWGYNQTLPIAKIDGISYNELANLFGFSNTPDGYTNLPIVTSSNSDIDSSSEQTLLGNLDSFRSNSNLANYQITTYTYDPIIGLTSITPATGIREFYKYDESNRLNQIIDVNGKILKEYSYHYSNKIPDDVVYSSISGPENINVYTTYLNAQASYSLNLANSPSDLNYYWSISPTTGVSYPSPYNSPNVSLTFNNSGQYKLSLYAIRSSTGESLSLSKTINVNVVLPPEYGSNSMFGINPVQVYTSGIYLNGNSVSGYFVFKPDIINGSKDIALISSDKAPYTDKTVTYHETGTGVDRNWTFIFKTNGVITASYTGTPLSSNSTINVSTFQYQK